MTPAFRLALLWIVGSLAMVVAVLTCLAAGYANGEYVPANADAFYHARRILDSVMSGAPVIQFDALIHHPEGSWLTWPWGFDQSLAGIVRLSGPFANEAQANRVLMNIPVAAAPLAIALVLAIARKLVLPTSLSALFMLGFALLPIIYMLFAVSNVDHHFAEMLWLLMTYLAGLTFFAAVRSIGGAVALGVVLGTAVAMHNGLFMLQIPVAAALALRWVRGEPLPARPQVAVFAGTLLTTTLLVCIPSEPWRRGAFEFYTLSWFHVYIAACVGGFSVWLTYWDASRKHLAAVVVAALLAVVPLIAATRLGGDFVTGQLNIIRGIAEVMSPYELWRDYGEAGSTRFYSWLMWLSAPALLLNLWWMFRWRDPALQFVALTNAFMLLLLQFQFRFGALGAVALLLTPVLAARELAAWRPATRGWIFAGCWVLFVVMFVPTLGNWTRYRTLAGNVAYESLRGAFPVLRQLCDERPGVVLGDLDTGHWVRYHTHCPVIANVFLLTPQHARKVFENQRLMALTPAQLLESDRDVRYVFAHHTTNMNLSNDPSRPESPNLDQFRLMMGGMERELLAPVPELPPQFKMRWQVLTPAGQVYARLFEIERN